MDGVTPAAAEGPATVIFDRDQAEKGYALTKMCYSLNHAGVFALGVQDLGARQTGVAAAGFRATLPAAAHG